MDVSGNLIFLNLDFPKKKILPNIKNLCKNAILRGGILQLSL